MVKRDPKSFRERFKRWQQGESYWDMRREAEDETNNPNDLEEDDTTFENTDYTVRNSDVTNEYLKFADSGVKATYGGGTVLPELKVKGNVPRYLKKPNLNINLPKFEDGKDFSHKGYYRNNGNSVSFDELGYLTDNVTGEKGTLLLPELKVRGISPETIAKNYSSSFDGNAFPKFINIVTENTIGRVLSPIIENVPYAQNIIKALTPSSYIGTIKTGKYPWDLTNTGFGDTEDDESKNFIFDTLFGIVGAKLVTRGSKFIKPLKNPIIVKNIKNGLEPGNKDLLYHLDFGDNVGAFSNYGAYIKNNKLIPGKAKNPSQLDYTWFNEEKPYSMSINEKPLNRAIIINKKDVPGLIRVRESKNPIGQWSGKKGFVLKSEFVTPETVSLDNAVIYSRKKLPLVGNFWLKNKFNKGKDSSKLIYQTINGDDVYYTLDPDGLSDRLSVVNKLTEDPKYWTYKDKSGKIYTPHKQRIQSGEIIQSPEEKSFFNDYFNQLKYEYNNGGIVSPKYTYPAAAALSAAIVFGGGPSTITARGGLSDAASLINATRYTGNLYGDALLKSSMSALGGGAVNNFSKLTTGQSFGKNIQDITEGRIASDVGDFFNPGYALGLGKYAELSRGVKDQLKNYYNLYNLYKINRLYNKNINNGLLLRLKNLLLNDAMFNDVYELGPIRHSGKAQTLGDVIPNYLLKYNSNTPLEEIPFNELYNLAKFNTDEVGRSMVLTNRSSDRLIHMDNTGILPASLTGFIPKTEGFTKVNPERGEVPEIWWNRNVPYYPTELAKAPRTIVSRQNTLEKYGNDLTGIRGKGSYVLHASGEVPFESIEYGLEPNNFGWFNRVKYSKNKNIFNKENNIPSLFDDDVLYGKQYDPNKLQFVTEGAESKVYLDPTDPNYYLKTLIPLGVRPKEGESVYKYYSRLANEINKRNINSDLIVPNKIVGHYVYNIGNKTLKMPMVRQQKIIGTKSEAIPGSPEWYSEIDKVKDAVEKYGGSVKLDPGLYKDINLININGKEFGDIHPGNYIWDQDNNLKFIDLSPNFNKGKDSHMRFK